MVYMVKQSHNLFVLVVPDEKYTFCGCDTKDPLKLRGPRFPEGREGQYTWKHALFSFALLVPFDFSKFFVVVILALFEVRKGVLVHLFGRLPWG